MAAALQLTGRGAATPGPVVVPSGGSIIVLDVPAGLLAWHAVFTGGPLPAGSSWLSRLMFRVSTESALWACLETTAGQWRATQLFHEIEISEKAQASYRLGTICAGVASDLALGLPLLVHRETLLGKSSGPRGDLLGLRTVSGDWHGVEAKGKSPEWPSGARRYVPPADFDDAKDQARSLGIELVNASAPTGAGDHWAITSRASISAALEMTLDDPPVDGSGVPPPPPDSDFPQDDPSERLLQGYYQVVGDIEALIDSDRNNTAPADFDGTYLGARVTGTDLWLGARKELFDARREQRLREVVPDLAQDTRDADDLSYAAVGLALARLSSPAAA